MHYTWLSIKWLSQARRGRRYGNGERGKVEVAIVEKRDFV